MPRTCTYLTYLPRYVYTDTDTNTYLDLPTLPRVGYIGPEEILGMVDGS
jgi:hypothetical protein